MVKVVVSGNSLSLKTNSIVLDKIRDYFSVSNNTFGKSDFANDKKYAITLGGSFLPGLLPEVLAFMGANRIPYTLEDGVEELRGKQIPAVMIEKLEGIEYRDYQIKAIQEFFLNGRGIAELPTSAGKTAVMAGFCKTYNKYNKGKILIAVPNKMLLEQTYTELKNFGVESITKFSGENKEDVDWNASVVVSTFAMLVQRRKVKETKTNKKPFLWLKTFKNYDVVIVDEVHQLHSKDNAIKKFIGNIKTPNKFGLTGTLPDDQYSKWTIIGTIGPVLIKKTSKEMRDMGYITDVDIKVVKFKHDNYVVPNISKDDPPTMAYNHEKNFMIKNKKRNNWLIKLLNKSKCNVLVLVDRIEHGEHLEKLCRTYLNDKQIFFARGITPDEERNRIKEQMEISDNVICVAINKLFSTGVSIKNLPWVVMTNIGKSKIQLLQTIGRSLRLHKNKEKAIIFDMADDTYYSNNHLGERLEYYEREEISYKIKEI